MDKTYSTKVSDIEHRWHVIDASDKILGRLATQVAVLLMGKHKPIYARHLDTGDFVIIINADKVRITGKKAHQKNYYRHSGYPGGLKKINYERMMQTNPTRVIEYAVKGMLPHNRLGRAMIKKLKVYANRRLEVKAEAKLYQLMDKVKVQKEELSALRREKKKIEESMNSLSLNGKMYPCPMCEGSVPVYMNRCPHCDMPLKWGME